MAKKITLRFVNDRVLAEYKIPEDEWARCHCILRSQRPTVDIKDVRGKELYFSQNAPFLFEVTDE